MANVTLSNALRNEYQQLFDSCQVRAAKAADVENLVDKLISNRARYEAVATPLGIPWFFVAVVHNMECSQNFSQHLHNGDPLTARTRQVPANRPKTGNPPFTWEASATDALVLRGMNKWRDWSIPGLLYSLEGYNGWGYRLYHPAVKSPYLWSGSNQYTSGKYVADGTWSNTAVSAQLGCATLLRRLAEKGQLDVSLAPAHVPDTALVASDSPLFRYAPDTYSAAGQTLQKFLNTLPNTYLKEDGKLGQKSSDVCKLAWGAYLPGDPRNP